jgi:hypothetical protein
MRILLYRSEPIGVVDTADEARLVYSFESSGSEEDARRRASKSSIS